MTAKGLIALARSYTGDDPESLAAQALGDPWYLAALNDGLRRLWNRLPESRLAADGVSFRSFSLATAETDEDPLWCDDRYEAVLAHFIAFSYFNRDAGDTKDAKRAKAHQGACSPLAD